MQKRNSSIHVCINIKFLHISNLTKSAFWPFRVLAQVHNIQYLWRESLSFSAYLIPGEQEKIAAFSPRDKYDFRMQSVRCEQILYALFLYIVMFFILLFRVFFWLDVFEFVLCHWLLFILFNALSCNSPNGAIQKTKRKERNKWESLDRYSVAMNQTQVKLLMGKMCFSQT